MLTDLQRTKLQNRFKLMDTDGDGYIKQDDFDQLVDRICSRVIPEGHTTEENEIREGYQQLFDYLCQSCDTDQDGGISSEEYLRGVEAGLLADPEHYDRSLGRALRALFNALDSNKDGRIVQDEFTPLGGTFGVPPEGVEMVFKTLDTDGDGEVTLEEFEVASRDLYYGDNPQTAAGKLFGDQS